MKVINRDVVDLIRWRVREEIKRNVSSQVWNRTPVRADDERVYDLVLIKVRDQIKLRIQALTRRNYVGITGLWQGRRRVQEWLR